MLRLGLFTLSLLAMTSCTKNYSCKCDVYLQGTLVHSYNSVPVVSTKSKAVDACVDKVVSSSQGFTSEDIKCNL